MLRGMRPPPTPHLHRVSWRGLVVASLLAAQPAAWAGVDTRVDAGGARVTQIRISGPGAFANLFDPTTQSSGFLTVARDAVGGTTSLDFAWAAPVPSDPRYIVLIAGAGEIPNSAFTVDRTGARLVVLTGFETVRCLVDLETGLFDCAPGPVQAFDLAWTRDGLFVEWEQKVSESRLGPLVVRAQGQYEQRSAQVAGTFGGLPMRGPLGQLTDTRGATVTRELSIKARP
jgi:hypothetical protein